jgi:hypothetical protein
MNGFWDSSGDHAQGPLDSVSPCHYPGSNLIREILMAAKPLVSDNPAGVIKLPEPRKDGKTSVESALHRRRSVRGFGKARLTPAEVSQLLWATQLPILN